MFIKSLIAVDNFTARSLYFLDSIMDIKTTATVTVTSFIWWLWLNESLLKVLSIMIYLSWLNFLKICWVLLLKDKTCHLEKMFIWWRWYRRESNIRWVIGWKNIKIHQLMNLQFHPQIIAQLWLEGSFSRWQVSCHWGWRE